MLSTINQNVLVCYLFTSFDNEKSFIDFINHYKKNDSGVKHNLLICFKLLNEKKIRYLKILLRNIKYIEFIDPVKLNDYDFGTYKRVAQKYSTNLLFFLNSHSYPLHKNWLKLVMNHYSKNTIIGTSATYESQLTSLKLKRFYKIFSYLKKLFIFKNRFPSFPNPHIRTSGFLISASDYILFTNNKNFYDKKSTWYAESGFNSLTNFFKKKNYNIYVVNSDGKKFDENNWKFSETYNFLNQSKSLISDKHSRKFLDLTFQERLISSRVNWGD
jgi:hypothetical protein